MLNERENRSGRIAYQTPPCFEDRETRNNTLAEPASCTECEGLHEPPIWPYRIDHRMIGNRTRIDPLKPVLFVHSLGIVHLEKQAGRVLRVLWIVCNFETKPTLMRHEVDLHGDRLVIEPQYQTGKSIFDSQVTDRVKKTIALGLVGLHRSLRFTLPSQGLEGQKLVAPCDCIITQTELF